MATYRKSILSGNLMPDGSGGCWFEPASVRGTNDPFPYLVAIYSDTATRDGIYGRFNVPIAYVGSSKIIVVWTSEAITGNVDFDFDYRAVGGNDTESLDQTGTQESLTVTDVAPSAAHERMEAELTFTASNLAASDTVQFGLFRDGTSESSGIADEVIVHDVLFEWADA